MWEALQQRHEAVRAFAEHWFPEYRVVAIHERPDSEYWADPDALTMQPYLQTALRTTYEVDFRHRHVRGMTAGCEISVESDGALEVTGTTYRLG